MKSIDDSNPALRPVDTATLPPTLKQREVAALERTATALEVILVERYGYQTTKETR